MEDRSRNGRALRVRGRGGRQTFWLVWRSGGRRQSVLLGGEGDGLMAHSASLAARVMLARPVPPSTALVRTVVGWATAIGRSASDA